MLSKLRQLAPKLYSCQRRNRRWQIILVVLGAILLIEGASPYIPIRASCRSLRMDDGITTTVVYLENSSISVERLPVDKFALSKSSSIRNLTPSPNKLYIAYTENYTDAAGHARYTLYIRSIGANTIGKPITIQANILFTGESDLRIFWSPNSNQMAYQWRDGSGRYIIGFADISGVLRNVLTGVKADVFEWSKDGEFFAFGINGADTTTRQVLFWSAEAKQITTSPLILKILPEDPDPFTRAKWSPSGHKIIYHVSTNEKTTGWAIVTPRDGKYQLFTLTHELMGHVLSWSPNGKYIFLASRTSSKEDSNNASRYAIDIYTTDGSEHVMLADMVASFGPYRPEISWSSDGQILVYMALRNPLADNGRLVTYHVSEKRYTALVDGTQLLYFVLPKGSKYVQTVWYRPDHAVLGLVEFETGKLYELMDVGAGVGNPFEIAVSPNGRIAAVSLSTGTSDWISLIATDGSGYHNVGMYGGHLYYDFYWSPDSTLLAIVNSGQGVFRLKVVDVNGKVVYLNEKMLGNQPTQVTWPNCT